MLLAISRFLPSELPEQPAIEKQQWLHWITNWPERLPDDHKYANLQKVPARLAREGDRTTFSFQIDNLTNPESILEHFKEAFGKRSLKHAIAYLDFL